MSGSTPVIALDCHESETGRGLLCLSSLYLCLDWIRSATIRLVNANVDNVRIAAHALEWEENLTLDFSLYESNGDSALIGADLYAGIAFGTAQHMFLEAATGQRVPTFVAIQFPLAEWLSPSVLLHAQAAFDPRVFATRLHEQIAPHDD